MSPVFLLSSAAADDVYIRLTCGNARSVGIMANVCDLNVYVWAADDLLVSGKKVPTALAGPIFQKSAV